MFYSKKEKIAYKAGLNKGKQIFNTSSNIYQPRYCGPTYVNGKFYDTNFKRPYELSREFIKKLHNEYDVTGHSSDKEVVDAYVKHMRRKYGVFDRNGNFLGMLGDE